MKPAPFDYLRPATLADALTALAGFAAAGVDARVLAGGQSLLPLLNLRVLRPAVLVDVNRIPELGGLAGTPDGLVAGAAVRQRLVEKAGGHPLLADALPLVGRVATRNRGTVCGSLAHADPAAELPAVAVAADATLTVASVRAERVVAAGDFFIGPHQTVLAADEMVTSVRFPAPAAGTGHAWREFGRRYADLPIVGVACAVSGRAVRLTYAGVRDRPWRLDLPAGPAADIAAEAARRCDPIDDRRAGSAYRRRLVRALTERAVTAAAGRRVR